MAPGRPMLRICLWLAAWLAAGSVVAAPVVCPPSGWTRDALVQLKADHFELADRGRRQALASGLLGCLDAPDPALRDGIAFEALSHWLRGGQIDVAARESMVARLSVMISDPDAGGFRAPFSALVLAEIIRTDRIEPWLTPEQRADMVQVSAAYLSAVHDYRGFDEQDGWRHGVAHGADLVLQLALNPAIDGAQLKLLLDAIGKQVAPPGSHFYTYGEPDRLARAALYIARRGLVDEADWQAWFDARLQPAPLANWDQAFDSQVGLAKRHNTRAFLLAVYAGTLESDSPAWRALADRARNALETLP